METNSTASKLQVGAAAATMLMALFQWQSMKLTTEESATRAKEAKEQREQERKYREATLMPYLAYSSMSSLIPLKLDDQRGGIEIAGELDSLPKIRNFGLGPALDASIEIVVTQIDGKEVQQSSKTILSPMNILPNMEAVAYALPDCIRNDKAKAIRRIDGSLTFRCIQLDGTERESSQKFFIQPQYHDKQPTLYLNVEGWKRLNHAAGW